MFLLLFNLFIDIKHSFSIIMYTNYSCNIYNHGTPIKYPKFDIEKLAKI